MGTRCMGVQVSLNCHDEVDILLTLALSPDRWDNLPEAVASQPGLYNNTLSFSAGPRVSGTVSALSSPLSAPI